MQRKNIFNCAANFLRGRKCIFCGSFRASKTARGYVRCGKKSCDKQKSLKQLRREIAILTGFCRQQPAYRVATDLGIDYQSVTRVYQRLREAICHVTELEGGKLKGERELDESYFGSSRKGKRGRGAAGKSIVFGLLERNGQVYTKVVEQVTADELMAHIKKHTRKGRLSENSIFAKISKIFSLKLASDFGKKWSKT